MGSEKANGIVGCDQDALDRAAGRQHEKDAAGWKIQNHTL